MRIITVIFCILWLSLPSIAQESKELLQVRTHFQGMMGEQEVKRLMNWPNKNSTSDSLRIEAYKAVATCMMAEYPWSPIRKLGYFRKGTRMLESIIEQDRNVENVYLRLLIQLKAPEILDYNQQVLEDLTFLKKAMSEAQVSEAYKEIMILNLKELLKEQENIEQVVDL